MDSFTLGILGNLEQMRYHEIRLCGRSRSDQECLVHLFGVLSMHVSLGVNTDSFNAKSVSRFRDTAGNFASIGDK